MTPATDGSRNVPESVLGLVCILLGCGGDADHVRGAWRAGGGAAGSSDGGSDPGGSLPSGAAGAPVPSGSGGVMGGAPSGGGAGTMLPEAGAGGADWDPNIPDRDTCTSDTD